ncbi:14172_t:CDS:2 [Acaulospora morrowiae]|uniref:14172_t:CDS:1 n=1 Tax=Acaulospora morrowiae TaxID=94023 RepID=A0A9N9F772_9GLOM|nr:14172_t:CDS:2 [Acaulospora morrowiae]
MTEIYSITGTQFSTELDPHHESRKRSRFDKIEDAKLIRDVKYEDGMTKVLISFYRHDKRWEWLPLNEVANGEFLLSKYHKFKVNQKRKNFNQERDKYSKFDINKEKDLEKTLTNDLKNDVCLDASSADQELITDGLVDTSPGHKKNEYQSHFSYLHQGCGINPSRNNNSKGNRDVALPEKPFKAFANIGHKRKNGSMKVRKPVNRDRFLTNYPIRHPERVGDFIDGIPLPLKIFEKSQNRYATGDGTLFDNDSSRHQTENHGKLPIIYQINEDGAFFGDIYPQHPLRNDGIFFDDIYPPHRLENFEGPPISMYQKNDNTFFENNVNQSRKNENLERLSTSFAPTKRGAIFRNSAATYQVNRRFTSEDGKITLYHRAILESLAQPIPISRREHNKLNVAPKWSEELYEKSYQKSMTPDLIPFLGPNNYSNACERKMCDGKKKTSDKQKKSDLQCIQTVEDTREIDQTSSGWSDHANSMVSQQDDEYFLTTREIMNGRVKTSLKFDYEDYSANSSESYFSWLITNNHERQSVPYEGASRKDKKSKKRDHWRNDIKYNFNYNLDGSRKYRRHNYDLRVRDGHCGIRKCYNNFGFHTKVKDFESESYECSEEWSNPKLDNNKSTLIYVNQRNLWWPWDNEEEFERDLVNMIKKEKIKVLKNLNTLINEEIEEERVKNFIEKVYKETAYYNIELECEETGDCKHRELENE